MSCPFQRMAPSVGSSRVAIIRIKVVLPAPLGPTSPSRPGSQRMQEGFLDQIFGQWAITADEALEVAEQWGVVAGHQRGQGHPIAGHRSRHQLFVAALLHMARWAAPSVWCCSLVRASATKGSRVPAGGQAGTENDEEKSQRLLQPLERAGVAADSPRFSPASTLAAVSRPVAQQAYLGARFGASPVGAPIRASAPLDDEEVDRHRPPRHCLRARYRRES